MAKIYYSLGIGKLSYLLKPFTLIAERRLR